MAAPATLTAATLEGQMLQMIEAVTNAQVAAILAAGANGASIKRMIVSNASDELGGLKTVTLSIPIDTVANANGLQVTAAVIYP